MIVEVVRAMADRVCKIPPATALLLFAMLLARLFPVDSPSPHPAPFVGSLWAEFSSLFRHEQNLHLVVNVMWAAYVCSELEGLSGSWAFLLTTTLVAILSRYFTMLINHLFAFTNHNTSRDALAFRTGLSGVLFSLNFLLAICSHEYQLVTSNLHIPDHHTHFFVMGVLMLIAALQSSTFPNAKFSDNLGGILTGFVWSKTQPHIATVANQILCIPHKLLGSFRFLSQDFFRPRTVEQHTHSRFASDNQTDRIYVRSRNHNENSISHGSGDEVQGHHAYATNRHIGEEEEELDDTLEWRCLGCNQRNGVFYNECEGCGSPW